MLALEVEYLLGRVFASNFSDQTESEWPPAPARLFSALAAAYFENGADSSEREALEWLERSGAPRIRAGTAGVSNKCTAFVPTNYAGDSVPVLRGKQPRYFPAQGPSEATVRFLWPKAEASADVVHALESLADRTACLGRAASLISMRVLTQEPEGVDSYVPDENGKHALRVAAPGRLEELRVLYAAGRRPTAGALTFYRGCDEAVEETASGSEFGSILFLRKSSGPGLPVDAALTVTSAARNALISLADSGGAVPDLIHGHSKRTHCAILAIPFVGAPFADAHLLGVGIVLPHAIAAKERSEVLRACAQLNERGLHIPGVGDWTFDGDDSFAAPANLRAYTWIEASKVWQTVTPILLDRFPKKNGPSVEEILAIACARIGLPAPESIEQGPYSSLPGVPPVPQFRLQRKADERPRWGVHAKLTFSRKVRGPILLGAGRYFGLGLLRPLAGGSQ